AATLLAANVVSSLSISKVTYALAYPERPSAVHKVANELFDTLPLFKPDSGDESDGLALRARQYHVQLHDEHWNYLLNVVQAFDPETTALLAVPDGAGSFRHLTYYAPEHRVYGVKSDLDETYGHLFTAHNGSSDYSVEGLEKASAQLDLPRNITHLVVPDRSIIDRFDENTDSMLVELLDGTEVLIVFVPNGSTLRFVEDREGEARIVVDCPTEAERKATTGGSPEFTHEKSSGIGTG
ncbi:MAG: hypothetical protein ACOC6A_04830, partial [Chloroflexota bacterium]